MSPSVNNSTITGVSDLQQAIAQGRNLQIGGFYPGYQGMSYYALTDVDAFAGDE